MEFSMAANGKLRPSDLGLSSSSFAKQEVIKFGEQADRPPELKQFATKLDERKQKSQLKGHLNTNSARHHPDTSDTAHSDSESEAEEEVSSKRKKHKSQHIMDRLDMEGDDGLETVVGVKGKQGIIHAGSHRQSLQSSGTNKGPSTASTKHSNFAEMEAIRNRGQEAYKAMMEKRRAAESSAPVFNNSSRK